MSESNHRGVAPTASLREGSYGHPSGRSVTLPTNPVARPNVDALNQHRDLSRPLKPKPSSVVLEGILGVIVVRCYQFVIKTWHSRESKSPLTCNQRAFSCLEINGAEGQSRTDTGCPTGF
jgi:hypothetical protein